MCHYCELLFRKAIALAVAAFDIETTSSKQAFSDLVMLIKTACTAPAIPYREQAH